MDANRAQFRITGPDEAAEEVIVGPQGFTLGRGADNDYVIRHREISRNHLTITWREEDGRFLVEDLDSSNGTWLNERRLLPNVAVELNEGDVIRVGPYLLRLDRLFVTTRAEPVPETAIAPPSAVARELPDIRRQIPVYLAGIARDRSTWLDYLPGIYSDHDKFDFLGRLLLIFESIWSPIIWQIDNFEVYLTADTAPSAWLRWLASWFDLLLVPELSLERQRAIVKQIGWLFLRRGTPAGLTRLLELYFGVTPEIVEDEFCHFIVRLPLSQMASAEDSLEQGLAEQLAGQLIDSQKPAFASYRLDII